MVGADEAIAGDSGPGDAARVRELLGRPPAGPYEVVVRNPVGEPVVIKNAPLLDDGTPMPTRYWLVGRDETLAVSRLEATGGVRIAEAAVDAAELEAAHARYAVERDAALPADAEPRPTGGVGGTRRGVKCLHAHYAWHLAGGTDPVGRWVADQFAIGNSPPGGETVDPLRIEIEVDRVVTQYGGSSAVLPIGPGALAAGELAEHDPPTPISLANALGLVTDHLDDVLREHPEITHLSRAEFGGEETWQLVAVERGTTQLPGRVTVDREDLEDLFRTLATETRAQRRHNPALDPGRVDVIVATCCTTLAIMRRLLLAEAEFVSPVLRSGS